MRFIVFTIVFILVTAIPVSAQQLQAPSAPASIEQLMPEETESFSQGLWKIIKKATEQLQPDIASASKTCLGLIAIVILASFVQGIHASSANASELAGVLAISLSLLQASNTFVQLAETTVNELSEYGKLLLPVMTTALAANGGISTSAAIYTATAVFDTILGKIIPALLIPLTYIYLCLGIASASIGENHLTKLKDQTKWLMTWSLKIILYVFTGYIGITKVISGATDAAALKATKLTISGMVPIIGGILSEASESVLVGAGIVKNSVGIYGLFVILSLFIGPFFKIGIHYLLLKSTAAIAEIFGSKRCVSVIKDFLTAMGFLLAMTGSVCILLLISIVCFMKGVGG